MTFEEFFVERYGEVVRCMRLVVGDSTRAEDLAEEAFVRAFRHWSRVSRLDRPVAWVYVVACNEARRGWRHEQRTPKWSGRDRPVVEDAAVGPIAPRALAAEERTTGSGCLRNFAIPWRWLSETWPAMRIRHR